ncbi:MAG: hypothetical protein WC566_11200 [Dehalococcoidia bacterium]
MVLQTPTGSDQAMPAQADITGDRCRHMMAALHELKSNIARVEQSHPHLGNDLSSTCDRAIVELQEVHCRQGSAGTPETIKTSSQASGTNPLSQTIDKIGGCIISGLDRMGDGIIFLFAKIGRAFS